MTSLVRNTIEITFNLHFGTFQSKKGFGHCTYDLKVERIFNMRVVTKSLKSTVEFKGYAVVYFDKDTLDSLSTFKRWEKSCWNLFGNLHLFRKCQACTIQHSFWVDAHICELESKGCACVLNSTAHSFYSVRFLIFQMYTAEEKIEKNWLKIKNTLVFSPPYV